MRSSAVNGYTAKYALAHNKGGAKLLREENSGRSIVCFPTCTFHVQ